ncbi:MAG: hypothetical protein JW873_05925 [Candidatus Saganbacteria bacterium]|nr:hypothetical protein [Candidatus Saganbacteria bacterium]
MIAPGGASGIGPRQGPYYSVPDAPLAFQGGEILINPNAPLPLIRQALRNILKRGVHTTHAKDAPPKVVHTKSAITLQGKTFHQLMEQISPLVQEAKGPGAKPIALGKLTGYTINSQKKLGSRVQTAAPEAGNPFAQKSTIDFMADEIGKAVDRLLGKQPLL